MVYRPGLIASDAIFTTPQYAAFGGAAQKAGFIAVLNGVAVPTLAAGAAPASPFLSAQATARAASSQARRFLDMRQTVAADARLLFGRPFLFFGQV